MAYELQGSIKLIYDLQTFPSGFSKREFVVTTTADRFPQDVKFECVKEKTAMLDNVNVGDPVNVFFDVRGNEFKEKYYVNLVAWKMEPLGSLSDVKGAIGGGGGSEGSRSGTAPEPPGGYFDEDSDDSIPF
jgi:single-strand DNA-binding protein